MHVWNPVWIVVNHHINIVSYRNHQYSYQNIIRNLISLSDYVSCDDKPDKKGQPQNPHGINGYRILKAKRK